MVPKEAQEKTKKTEFSIPAETSKSENHQNKAAAPQINHCRSGLVAHAEGASWHLCAGSRLAIDRVIAFLGQLLLVAQSEWKKGATKRLQKLQENPCSPHPSSLVEQSKGECQAVPRIGSASFQLRGSDLGTMRNAVSACFHVTRS